MSTHAKEGLTVSWRCQYCLKEACVVSADDEVVNVYAMKLPEGWVWEKYDSARSPNRDTRALGCCAEHAKLAADKYRIPPEMKPIGFEE